MPDQPVWADALKLAELRAYQARRAAARHRETRIMRDASIRTAASRGAGTRELARATDLDPAFVHRIIHTEPKDD